MIGAYLIIGFGVGLLAGGAALVAGFSIWTALLAYWLTGTAAIGSAMGLRTLRGD